MIFLLYVEKHGIQCPMKALNCKKFNFTGNQSYNRTYKMSRVVRGEMGNFEVPFNKCYRHKIIFKRQTIGCFMVNVKVIN